MKEPITLLHLSHTQFGRHHRIESDAPFERLLQRLCDDLVEPWREEIRPQVIVVCDTGARLATLFSTAVGPRSHRIDAYKISGNLGGAFWYAICLCRFERGELDPYCGSEFRTRALRCACIAHWRNGAHRSRFGLGGYSRRSRRVIASIICAIRFSLSLCIVLSNSTLCVSASSRSSSVTIPIVTKTRRRRIPEMTVTTISNSIWR
jgi:hypothetical protein